MKSFRENHLFKILDSYESQHYPLDVFLSHYFRANKAIGSRDRREIAETVYGMIRWRGLLDHLSTKPVSWEKRLALFKASDLHSLFDDLTIPPHIRVSFPKALFQLLVEAYGEIKALNMCLISNSKAPTTLRANGLKIKRDELIAKWQGVYPISPCTQSEFGIHFHGKANFFAMSEFKEGLFEIQDEGSQIVANLIDAKPGQQILDFCSGSGGKTLAFAPKMEHSGQIYLHDVRPLALQQAKKRLYRAGIQNAQVLLSNDLKKQKLKQKMDWVLVDGPCTGSGTLRRNPDMKWKFDPTIISRITQEQREIFQEALEFLQPKGYIVYATCSVLPQENEEQIAFFQNQFQLKLVKEPFKSFPQKGGMDGFFAAVLSKN